MDLLIINHWAGKVEVKMMLDRRERMTGFAPALRGPCRGVHGAGKGGVVLDRLGADAVNLGEFPRRRGWARFALPFRKLSTVRLFRRFVLKPAQVTRLIGREVTAATATGPADREGQADGRRAGGLPRRESRWGPGELDAAQQPPWCVAADLVRRPVGP